VGKGLSVVRRKVPISLLDQPDYVRGAPTLPHVVMPNHTFRSLLCVGYRDKVASQGNTSKREKLDLGFMNSYPSQMYDKYKWMFPDNDMVNKATLRFDEVLSVDASPDDAGATFALLLEVFSPLLDSCDVLLPHDVKINHKSACGPNYEYGGTKTGELIKNYPKEFSDCWFYAHKHNFPMYWKASGKIEMLSNKKLEDRDCRTFLFPDAPHRFSGQRMTQNFNVKMGALKNHWSKIGFDRTHGGFATLGEEFSAEWKYFFEGDLKKWDARMCRFLLMVCMYLRWCCYKPEYRTLDNWERLVYQYKNKIKSMIFLPTGQCVFVDHGNKSGQDSTSYDNTIAHIFIYLYEARFVMLEMNLEPTWNNIKVHLGLGLYGDDSLGGTSKAFYDSVFRSHGSLVNWLTAMYTRWGMIFKTAECKVQTSLEGLKFIGGIFKRCPYGWAHTFNVERAMCAMVRALDNPKPNATWSKYVSLLALMAFEPERHQIRSWMQKWLANLPPSVVLENSYIPSDYDLYVFWFGWESPNPRLALQLPVDLREFPFSA